MMTIIFIYVKSANDSERTKVLRKMEFIGVPVAAGCVPDPTQFWVWRGKQYDRSCPVLIATIRSWIDARLLAKPGLCGEYDGPFRLCEVVPGKYEVKCVRHFEQLVLTDANGDTEEPAVQQHSEHPSCDYAIWSYKMQRLNRQFRARVPLPLWMYGMRSVHEEMADYF